MLVEDPCALLLPVSDCPADRYEALARDYDGANGARTLKSYCEARLSLTLESRGILPPLVTRPAKGDVEDGEERVWDYKAPRSREAIRHSAAEAAARRGDPPPAHVGFRGEYNLDDELLKVLSEQATGEGVIVDLRRLTYAQAVEIQNALRASAAVDQERLLFFPDDLSPYRVDDNA